MARRRDSIKREVVPDPKYNSELVALSSGFLIPAAVGFILGEKVRVYISEKIFYQILMIFLFIVSINLIIKSSIFINL